LDFLQLDGSEQFDVQSFEFLINQYCNALQNGRTVFGVWIDHSLQIRIGLCFKHLLLHFHHFFENTKNVSLGILNAIEKYVIISLSELPYNSTLH
jgi:hypothetical protein